MKSMCWPLVCLAVLPITQSAQAANAGPFSITCEKEDVQNADWTGPLTVTYSGGLEGEINVKSKHMAMKLPATVAENSGVVDGIQRSTTAIRGSEEMLTQMPDPKALLACATANISTDFKDDPDMQAVEIANCVAKAVVSPTPILVNANVTVGLIPTQDAKALDVIVEIKRRYVETVTSLGKDIVIETYPANCTLESQ